jgi:glycosyltransferase involved in cell wall biosynthesis
MENKTTILVLASTFPRWKNDTEPRFVYDLCKKITDEFHVIVLAPHCRNSKKYELFDDLEVYRYQYAPKILENLAYEGGINASLKKNKLNWLILPFFLVSQIFSIYRLINKYSIQGIHAHWLLPQGILALLARSLTRQRPKILCTSHGADLYSLNDPLSKKIKKYVINNVEALTVVSSAMQDDINTISPYFKKNIIVAPMGADLTTLFYPINSVTRNPFQLLFVGRLVEKKGIIFLLKAIYNIKTKYPNIRLNIAGTGPEEKKLKSLTKSLKIQTHVTFLGRLSHEQLVSQYRMSIMSIFPFIQAKDGDIEGLGLVMIEAMGCECPVIASNIPAVKDVIIDNKNGILIKPASEKSIEEKIIYLLSNPNKAKNIAKNGREFVLDHFSWESSSQNYRELLRSILP